MEESFFFSSELVPKILAIHIPRTKLADERYWVHTRDVLS